MLMAEDSPDRPVGGDAVITAPAAKAPLLFQNEGQRTVYLLHDSAEAPLPLAPGERLELDSGNGPYRFVFYDEGLQIAGGHDSSDGLGVPG